MAARVRAHRRDHRADRARGSRSSTAEVNGIERRGVVQGDLVALPRRARARGRQASERRPAPAHAGRRRRGPAVPDRLRRVELRRGREGRRRAAGRDAAERADARPPQAARRDVGGDDPRRGRGRPRHGPRRDHGARRRARARHAARRRCCRSSRRCSRSRRPATAPTCSRSTASRARSRRSSAASSCRSTRASLRAPATSRSTIRDRRSRRLPALRRPALPRRRDRRSPVWLKARLRAAGVRSISNVVDVTNYVMLALGSPLHAFDFETLHGGTVVVRRAQKGEKLRTLDGTERTLDPSDLVIADADRAIALAGIMGGAETEVSEQTTSRAARGGELRAGLAPAHVGAARASHRGLEPLGEGRRPVPRRAGRDDGDAADRRARRRALDRGEPTCRRSMPTPAVLTLRPERTNARARARRRGRASRRRSSAASASSAPTAAIACRRGARAT